MIFANEESMEIAREAYRAFLMSHNVPDAYENWREYRESITDFIIEAGADSKEILLLGVGESNDIDLKKIAQNFDRIYLADINLSAVEKAIENINTDRSKFVIAECNLTGIDEEDCINVAGACVMYKAARISETTVLDEITGIYEKISCIDPFENSLLYNKEFDCIVMIGVNSQLNNMFSRLSEIIIGNSFLTNEIISKSIGENKRIIERVNNKVFEKAKKCVVLGDEVCRIGNDDMIAGAKEAFDNTVCGVRSGKITVKNYLDVIWPFDVKGEKEYRMYISNIRKNNQLEEDGNLK